MRLSFTSIAILSFALILGCSKGGGGNTPAPPPVTPAPVLTYQLVWSDEFNTDGAPDATVAV